MAKAKKDNINDYSDRFSSPIGVKNLVLPKNKNTGNTKRKSGTKKK